MISLLYLTWLYIIAKLNFSIVDHDIKLKKDSITAAYLQIPNR